VFVGMTEAGDLVRERADVSLKKIEKVLALLRRGRADLVLE
jgi:hypothetical protein